MRRLKAKIFFFDKKGGPKMRRSKFTFLVAFAITTATGLLFCFSGGVSTAMAAYNNLYMTENVAPIALTSAPILAIVPSVAILVALALLTLFFIGTKPVGHHHERGMIHGRVKIRCHDERGTRDGGPLKLPTSQFKTHGHCMNEKSRHRARSNSFA